MAKHDPYMRDPNIAKAANLQRLAWPALGAALGAAVSGWFQFSAAIGIAAGAVLGFVAVSLILTHFGGRATR